MKRKPLSEIERRINLAVARLEEDIAAWEGVTNPQVVEMRTRAEGELRAYRSVLDALHGNNVFLNIAARI